MTEQGPTFFIGELVERTGVSRDAIRYYEASGVLPPAESAAVSSSSTPPGSNHLSETDVPAPAPS